MAFVHCDLRDHDQHGHHDRGHGHDREWSCDDEQARQSRYPPGQARACEQAGLRGGRNVNEGVANGTSGAGVGGDGSGLTTVKVRGVKVKSEQGKETHTR
jgi:hypothetical protein